MEAAADEKYFLDLAQDHAAAEASFGQFLDDDARDNGRFFLHIPSCNGASGCNCNFARLNGSEITALSESVLKGMSAVLPDPKQHNITISPNEKTILGIISAFFGVSTGRNSAEANSPKPTSGIRIMTTGESGRCFWGPEGILKER